MRKKKRHETGPGGDNPGNDKNPSDGRGQHLSSKVCGFCAVLSNCRSHAQQSRLIKGMTSKLFSLACIKYEDPASHTYCPDVTRRRTTYVQTVMNPGLRRQSLRDTVLLI